MPTIVFVHAHPDDEASQTSGSMALAVRAGHRVVVAFATNGEHGEVPDDLGEEPLADYRRREAQASADVIGTHRVCWLGYSDSGMSGWAANEDPASFHRAPLDEAAGRLAVILDEEDADLVVGYDWHGGYGHPDHVKVHHVTRRAAQLARRTPRLLEQTMNRDHMRRLFEMAQAAGMDGGWDPDRPMDDGNPFGTPEAEIAYRLDISSVLDVKRASLGCHRSQKSDIGSFLAMPPEVFAMGFGAEYFIDAAAPDAVMRDANPFDEL